MIFQRLRAWLRLDDYAAAKDKATDDIIARYSRGNTEIQNGHYLDRDKLNDLSARGDEAMSRLEKMVQKHAG
jgi:hypothetical protein